MFYILQSLYLLECHIYYSIIFIVLNLNYSFIYYKIYIQQKVMFIRLEVIFIRLDS